MAEDDFQNLEPIPLPEDSRFPDRHNVMPKSGDEELPDPFSREFNFPMLQQPMMDGFHNSDFRPQRGDAYDEVRLKADIKTRKDNDFTEQTGWIYWRRIGADSSSSSSSSSSSASSDSSSSSGSGTSSTASGSDSGSAKDSCIIPVSWGSGYSALYCTESKDVLFLEIQSLDLDGRVTATAIDEKFVEVCKPGSLKIYGLTGEDGLAWGKVKNNHLVITRPWLLNKATRVNALIIGLRGDCDQNPWPDMNRDQFDFNEERIKSFHPKD